MVLVFLGKKVMINNEVTLCFVSLKYVARSIVYFKVGRGRLLDMRLCLQLGRFFCVVYI